MLNVAICDDDIHITGEMDTLVVKIAKHMFVDVEIEVFWNGESLVESIALILFSLI